MAQLKITPQISTVRTGESTPQQMGAGIGTGLREVGTQVQALGRIADNISQSRARATAARFDAALGLREEAIKADVNNIDNWETEMETARSELMEQYGETKFINRGVFANEAGLRFEQRKVGIASHKNRLLVEMGTAAMDENLRGEAEAFALSNDPDQQAVHFGRMAAEVKSGVENGLIFESQIEAKVRSAQTAGVLGAYERMLNSNPLMAIPLIQNYVGVVGVKAAESLTKKAWDRYQSDLSSANQSEAASQGQIDRARKEKQRNNANSITAIASPNGGGLTTAYLDDLFAEDSDALTEEGWVNARGIVSRGGFLPSSGNVNPQVNSQLTKIAMGIDPPEFGTSLREMVDFHTFRGDLSVPRAEQILKISEKRRFSSPLKAADRVVQALALGGTASALAGGKFEEDVHEFILDNPDAEREQVVEEMNRLYKYYDPYKLKNALRVSHPKFFVFDGNDNILIDESISAMQHRRTKSLALAEGYRPGQRHHLTEEKMRSEHEYLMNLKKHREDLATLNGGSGGD